VARVPAESLSVPDSSAPVEAETVAILRAQSGEREAMDDLLRRYRGLVLASARRFRGLGLEMEDLTQIGMIGLWHAIMQFRRERCNSFASYASLCVRRHLISAAKERQCLRRRGDRNLLSMGTEWWGEQSTAHSLWSTTAADQDPVDRLIETETYGEICHALQSILSPVEWQVLLGHQAGRSYREIAHELQCSVKSVDNALSRIRRKVQSLVEHPAALCRLETDRSGCRSRTRVRLKLGRRKLHGLHAAQAPV